MIFTDAPVKIIWSKAFTNEGFAGLYSTVSIGNPQIIQFELTNESMSTFDISFGVDILNTDEPEWTDEVCN